MTWNDWYTTLRGCWMKKGDKYLRLFNLGCVNPLCIRWLGRSTWQMSITNDLCEVHKRHIKIYLGMNPKQCSNGSEWSEHEKQMNEIHFECERRDIARTLNYSKYIYPSNMTAIQVEKPGIKLLLYLYGKILWIKT